MDVINFVAQYGVWSWVIGGLVLLALELVVPGGVFIWLGISAIVTGIIALLIPVYWPLNFLIFGVLAVVTIVGWLKYRPHGEVTDRPLLNRRTAHFVGREVVLDEPISDGFGRVAIGDTTWRVQGPDLAAGVKVRIVDADGAVLKVVAV